VRHSARVDIRALFTEWIWSVFNRIRSFVHKLFFQPGESSCAYGCLLSYVSSKVP